MVSPLVWRWINTRIGFLQPEEIFNILNVKPDGATDSDNRDREGLLRIRSSPVSDRANRKAEHYGRLSYCEKATLEFEFTFLCERYLRHSNSPSLSLFFWCLKFFFYFS